jgi:hypothetical protein
LLLLLHYASCVYRIQVLECPFGQQIGQRLISSPWARSAIASNRAACARKPSAFISDSDPTGENGRLFFVAERPERFTLGANAAQSE